MGALGVTPGKPVAATIYLRGTAGRDAVEAVLGPGVKVDSRVERHERELNEMAGSVARYRLLAGLAAVVGLFGIVGTLALSIVERRRELAMLHAVGMQRSQIRRMISIETVTVALVGGLLGIGLGVLFGWGAARVLEHSSEPTEFTLPIWPLLALAGLVGAAGLLVAAVPARLASRADILRTS